MIFGSWLGFARYLRLVERVGLDFGVVFSRHWRMLGVIVLMFAGVALQGLVWLAWMFGLVERRINKLEAKSKPTRATGAE